MSLFPNPLWLVILPIAMAPVIYVVRKRERIAGFLAVLTTLFAARICLSLPFDWAMELQGRTMSLEAPSRMLLASAFLIVTLYFAYAIYVRQERSFFPLILVIMGLLSAATMIDSLIVAVLILEMAAMIIVLLVQAGRRQSVMSSLHYLVSMVIAVPPLLLTAHLTEVRILNPTDTTLPELAAFLLVLGISLFLGAVPFQAWLHAVSIGSSPTIAAFIFSVAHSVIFFKLFELLHRFPWLVTDGHVVGFVSVIGLGSMILGSVFAAFQRDFGKLLAWAVLFDTGFFLVGLSATSSSAQSLSILTLLLFNRMVSVTLLGMGMNILEWERGSNVFRAMANMVRRKPLAVLAVAVGGLSLAGFPLTGGFTARWLTVQELPVGVQRWAWLLVIASAAVSIGYLRGISFTTDKSETEITGQVSFVADATILLFLLANLALALYPQLFLDPIVRVMAGWSIAR